MKSLLRQIALPLCAILIGPVAVHQPPRHRLAPRSTPFTGLTPRARRKASPVATKGPVIPQRHATPSRPSSRQTTARLQPGTLTIADGTNLWPQVGGVATVYYVIDSASDPNATPNINAAIAISNADFSGLLQWVPWTSSDGPNYVDINLNAFDFSGQCEANEGYEAVPAQPMTGSTNCTVATILHEMGHVIGLLHEFQRPDRDNYVTVNYDNAIKGSWGNFEILTQNEQVLAPYDYASLMQYPPYSFSRNGGPVIETIPAGMALGGEGVPVPAAADYSAGDKETIERLYGSPPTEITVTSNPVGLQVEVDGAPITTPQTFVWALNSTHTLSVAGGVQTLTGDITDSTTSASFYYTYGRWNDSTAQSHTITVLPGNGGAGFPSSGPQVATYSANFIQLVPYTPAVYPAGSGSMVAAPPPMLIGGKQFFLAREKAVLVAAPAANWNFYEFNNGPFWLPGGLGANPKNFYVPDTGNPVNPVAEFSNTPVYTVDTVPNSFSSNLYAFVDGGFVYTPKNFSSYYDSSWTAGSTHTLSVDSLEYPYSVNSRFAFNSWSDGGAQSHSIASLPAASTSYVATMTPQYAPATNFNFPPCGGAGTLTPSSPTGDGFYPTGQQLTYSAAPDAGWTFAGWTFDLTGTQNPANRPATDETLVFANFNIVASPLTLTGVSPSSDVKGGPGLTLTLIGTGFSPGSLVSANGQYRTVTYINPQELQVPLTAADFASAGPFQVFVENFPQGWNGCAVFGYQTFEVNGSALATSTGVVSSSNPAAAGSTVTLTAKVTSPENNATGTVTFMDGSTVLGTGPLNGGGVATFIATGPATGTHSITAQYGGDSNNQASTSPTLVQIVSSGAGLVSPAPGSTLPGSSVTFSWSAVSGSNGYSLWLGSTGPGSSNLYNMGLQHMATSASVSGLPTNGTTIYARLFTFFNGAVEHTDYTFTAAGP